MDVNILFPEIALCSKPIKERVNKKKMAKLRLLKEGSIQPPPPAIAGGGESVAISSCRRWCFVTTIRGRRIPESGLVLCVKQLQSEAVGIEYGGVTISMVENWLTPAVGRRRRGRRKLFQLCIEAVQLGNQERLLAFCEAVQRNCPVCSFMRLVAGSYPGYASEVIFANGTFSDGSTSELNHFQYFAREALDSLGFRFRRGSEIQMNKMNRQRWNSYQQERGYGRSEALYLLFDSLCRSGFSQRRENILVVTITRIFFYNSKYENCDCGLFMEKYWKKSWDKLGVSSNSRLMVGLHGRIITPWSVVQSCALCCLTL